MSKDSSSSAKPAPRKPPSVDCEVMLVGPEPMSGSQPGQKAATSDTDPPAAAGGAATEVFDGARPAPQERDDTQAFDEAALAEEAKKIAVTKVPASPVVPAKTSVIGDYKLAKKLGQGGMGTVYKAHQVSLDRDVAVKVISKELAGKPALVQRFLREARVMAKLDHPNILRCFDVGEALGFHYLSMEYVEGGSLETWLKKLGKFELGDALLAVITTAHALQHAHEQGTIHRDIKPDNILLTKIGVIKVADLGLAKAADDDLGLTKTGTGAGTPIYMAPEQARDAKHVDARCDIYALGVMLYVFLTGHTPFQGETLVELVEAKEKAKFKPIRAYDAEVPERIDLIVDKMLAKDPKHRYASCAEVATALEALGLANATLSFFGPAASATPSAASAAAPKPTMAAGFAKSPAATAPPRPMATKAPEAQAPKIEADIWYWKHSDPRGRTITKKVTTAEIMTLIKNNSIDANGQLSRLPGSGYRAIGAYIEFESYFRTKIAEKKAGRGAEKYKDMLEQIEQEEARKQRWKSVRRFFDSIGSFVGLVIWLSIIAAIIVGIIFGVKKFMP